ncbi:MAG: LCP family protein, partial [Elusimicrobiota bacterium]|nr:LCP family protein [Elusimicrobiota bacterium]
MKNSRFPKIITVTLAAGFLFIAVTAFSPVKREQLSGRRFNILLLGVSEIDHTRHAEVIKIISIEPSTMFFDIVSVPRDTMIPVDYEVTWKMIQKADEIYARYRRTFKDDENIFEEFSAKLERFIDNRLKLDYYFKINYRAFVDIIDSIGRVELEIVRPMFYEDTAQDLKIDISSGTQKLDGKEALKYVRYRDNITGDIGRLARQHKFLEALIQKLKSPLILTKFPGLISAAVRNIDTNLSWPDVLTFIDVARRVEFGNVRFQQLPGEPEMRWGKSYWNVDAERMSEIMDVVNNSKFINMPAADVDTDSALARPVTAEVWNASDKTNYARRLTDYLRKRNVDVVRYDNYGAYKRYTQIVSRNGELKPAREVARIIGCRNIKTEIDMNRMVDINV